MVMKEIRNRRSVRSYKKEPVSDSDILELLTAAQFAPNARHKKAVDFIVVKNPEIKKEIFEIIDQDFIKDAAILIVPAADTKANGLPIQDISVASENIMLQATALGLGSVWKHLHEEWIDPIKNILGIPENFALINIIAVGYAAETPEPHIDADFDSKKIHNDKW